VARVAPGLVAIAGGKYTTYRVMGADAVDAAAQDIPARVGDSVTEKVPLLGADGYFALINKTGQLGERYGLHPYRVHHLLDRYGSLLHEVLGLAGNRPELLRPITAAPDYLRVEVVYGATYEGALHLEDVLARRTRISIEYAHRGVDCAQEVAQLMASALGWDEATTDREVASYCARVQAEIDSQTQDSDDARTRCVPRPPRPGWRSSNPHSPRRKRPDNQTSTGDVEPVDHHGVARGAVDRRQQTGCAREAFLRRTVRVAARPSAHHPDGGGVTVVVGGVDSYRVLMLGPSRSGTAVPRCSGSVSSTPDDVRWTVRTEITMALAAAPDTVPDHTLGAAMALREPAGPLGHPPGPWPPEATPDPRDGDRPDLVGHPVRRAADRRGAPPLRPGTGRWALP